MIVASYRYTPPKAAISYKLCELEAFGGGIADDELSGRNYYRAATGGRVSREV